VTEENGTKESGTKELALNPGLSLMELGKTLVASGYFKDAEKTSQAIVKVLAGRELGIPAISAMTGIYVIQGRVTFSANLMAAQVRNSKRYDYNILHLGDDYAEIEFVNGERVLGTSKFTIEDAKRAGTKNMDKFPRNMLFARAMSNGVKWFCPDLFGAPVYTPEELGANVDVDGNVLSLPKESNGHVVEGRTSSNATTQLTDGDTYTVDQIGPDFDATQPATVVETVDQGTGEIKAAPATKKAESKKPEAKPGEVVISPEYVKGVLEYRKENDVEMVRLGGNVWKVAEKVAGTGMGDKQVEQLLGLFIDTKTGKPNQFEAGNHLKKRFKGKMSWRSLTWEEVAAVISWKAHGIPDPRWYPEEAAAEAAKTKTATSQIATSTVEQVPFTPAPSTQVSPLRGYYGIPADLNEAGISSKEVEAFVESMAKLPDPYVLKVLLDNGMKANTPANFEQFSNMAQLLSEGLPVDGDDFKTMVDYILANYGPNAASAEK